MALLDSRSLTRGPWRQSVRALAGHGCGGRQEYRGLGLPLVGELLQLRELVLVILVGRHCEGGVVVVVVVLRVSLVLDDGAVAAVGGSVGLMQPHRSASRSRPHHQRAGAVAKEHPSLAVLLLLLLRSREQDRLTLSAGMHCLAGRESTAAGSPAPSPRNKTCAWTDGRGALVSCPGPCQSGLCVTRAPAIYLVVHLSLLSTT